MVLTLDKPTAQNEPSLAQRYIQSTVAAFGFTSKAKLCSAVAAVGDRGSTSLESSAFTVRIAVSSRRIVAPACLASTYSNISEQYPACAHNTSLHPSASACVAA